MIISENDSEANIGIKVTDSRFDYFSTARKKHAPKYLYIFEI